MYDILIKNGIVFDGSGQTEGLRTDVAIENGEIVRVADMPSDKAREVIDAEGMYICPGFIDTQNHSDSHGVVMNKPALESLVGQGITTAVIGQCGASLAPLPNSESVKSLQKWGILEGVNTDWRSFAEFSNVLSDKVFGVNITSLAGHATVRRSLVGDAARALTEEEIQQLVLILDRSLNEGAAGVSFGFQYGHEVNTTRSEFLAVLEIVKKHDKMVSIHLRSHEDAFLDSVRQVVDAASEVKARIKISHFKIEGKANLSQLKPALKLIEHSYQSGSEIHFDVYPYTTSWRPLYTYLPRWAYEGGFKPTLERLKNKGTRSNIAQELMERRVEIGALIVSSSPRVREFVGKKIDHIAASQKVAPEEALIRILYSNQGQAVVFDNDIDPGQTTLLLKHPMSFVASDAVGYPYEAKLTTDLPHPRCFGTFPRFLRLQHLENQSPLMPWKEAIYKITGKPGAFLGLQKKGLLKKGFDADVTVFDPHTIADMASYTNPYKKPEGIQYVINRGKISVFDGQLTGIYGGKFLGL